MPLLLLLGLFVPRIAIVVLWLLTPWFQGVFKTVLWPILGFIFLPLTLLWSSAVQHFFGGQWTAGAIIGLVIAVLLDLSPARGWGRRRETIAD